MPHTVPPSPQSASAVANGPEPSTSEKVNKVKKTGGIQLPSLKPAKDQVSQGRWNKMEGGSKEVSGPARGGRQKRTRHACSNKTLNHSACNSIILNIRPHNFIVRIASHPILHPFSHACSLTVNCTPSTGIALWPLLWQKGLPSCRGCQRGC